MSRTLLSLLGRLAAVLTLLTGLLGVQACAAEKDEVPPPKLIKLKDFDAAVKAQKGKVIVVDFWADY